MKIISLFSLILFSTGTLPIKWNVTQNNKASAFSGNSGVTAVVPNNLVSFLSGTASFSPAFFNKLNSPDSIINPSTTSNGTPDVKTIISNGVEGMEFTPFSSQINGGLIQPIDRINNKGISTAFYLHDSTNWSFYTNSQQRLLINGDGRIVANSSLLIENREKDNNALRVIGNALFDSSITVQSQSNPGSFISINDNVKYAGTEPDDGISPYTTTPIAWANGNNIPVFRLRHPNVVAYPQYGVNTSVQQDFMILPYQYGTAIEYNGVVECWVGEWSIHKGLHYQDAEGKGNGWGGILWVGNDRDDGGVRATARNNSDSGGNVIYGELSVEKFAGEPNGDFRLRLPDTVHEFHFVYGERGSNNVIAKVNNNGLVIPKVSNTSGIQSPEIAQITFDSTDNQFKGYNGTQWITLNDNGLLTGSAIQSGDDVTQDFLIAHNLQSVPSYFNVLATSPGAANISYVTADSNYLIIHYKNIPATGTNNLSWNWQIKK